MQTTENKQESGKIQKKFQESMKKLTALLNGETLYTPLKMEGEDIQKAVEELAKEEKKELMEEFKKKAKELIQEKRTFDKFVVQQKKELDKKVEEKQKAFTEQASKLFGIVKNIQNIEKEYTATIKSTDESVITPDETEEEEETTEE